MKAAIEVQHLQKSYGEHTVLHGLTFQVRPGEIFALLGVNGAGKTTALECMEGLRQWDGGSIAIAGTTGIQLQSASLPGHIKVQEAVKLFSLWKRAKPDAALLESLGIPGLYKKQYQTLSTGQKRRVVFKVGRPDPVPQPPAGEGKDNFEDLLALGQQFGNFTVK